MAAHEITEDQAYRLWVALNPGGYVLNTGPDPQSGEAMLHRADCIHIGDHKTGHLAGKHSRKFVAETKQEMRELARKLHRAAGARWSSCGTCGA